MPKFSLQTKGPVDRTSSVSVGGGSVGAPATLFDATDYGAIMVVHRIGVVPFRVCGSPPSLGGVAIDTTPPPTQAVAHGDLLYLKVDCVFGAGTPEAPDVYVATIERQAGASGLSLMPQELTASGFIGRLPLGGVLVGPDGALILSTRGQSSSWSRIEVDATATGVYFWSF